MSHHLPTMGRDGWAINPTKPEVIEVSKVQEIIDVKKTFGGRVKSIRTTEGLLGTSHKIETIDSVEIITPESGHDLGGAAAGAVALGVLTGGIGFLVGGVLGAGKNKVGVVVTFKNGTKKVYTSKSSYLPDILAAIAEV